MSLAGMGDRLDEFRRQEREWYKASSMGIADGLTYKVPHSARWWRDADKQTGAASFESFVASNFLGRMVDYDASCTEARAALLGLSTF